MKNVISIKPEETIESSVTKFYLILFSVDDQVYSYTGNGFTNIEHSSSDGINMQPFRKEEAAKQYYAALRAARDWMDGKLDLVPLPLSSPT